MIRRKLLCTGGSDPGKRETISAAVPLMALRREIVALEVGVEGEEDGQGRDYLSG